MTKNTFENLIDECNSSIEDYQKYLTVLRGQLEKIEVIKKLNTNLDTKPSSDKYLDDLKHFNNYTGLILISFLDLAICIKNLPDSNSDWEKAFFIKNSFLVILETIKKIDPQKGPSYVNQNIGKNSKKLRTEFERALQEIRSFSEKDVFLKIKEVRNSIAGHIDKDLRTYYNTVKKLDGDEAAIAIIEFLKPIHNIINLLFEYSIEQNNELVKINKELIEMLPKTTGNNNG